MHDRGTGPLVLTLVAAQFVVMLDSSILNVALPSLAHDLNLSAVGTAWVLNAYFLTFGGLLLISGRAADVFGRRRMFLLGAAVLVAGSLAGGMASTETMLMIARLVQGAGAALLSPAAMSIILARYTGRARAGVMSAWGAASTVGGAAGVSLGGVLTSAVGWQGVLFVTAAVAALIAGVAWFTLPGEQAAARRSFDAGGASLVTAAAVAAVFAVLSAPHSGLTSPEVLIAVALAAACLGAFVFVEQRSADPVLPLGLFREARVAGGVAVNMLGGASRVACFVLVALLLQQVLQYAADATGMAMLPTSLAGFAVSTLLLPKLLGRFGAERVTVLGLLLLALAHCLLSMVDFGDPYTICVLPALVLAAAGVALSFTPTTLVIAQGMAARNAGVSSGLASSTAQIGGALGIAVFGAVDAASRAAVISDGGSAGAAAEAGLWAAHLAAAILAAIALAVAVVTFPVLRRPTSDLASADPPLVGPQEPAAK